jgi:ABC-2 type transport system permease protein
MTPRPHLLPVDSLGARADRIWALVLRSWYLIRSSWPRAAELVYWPLVQMLMWGFLQLHLSATSSYYAKAGGLLIGAVLLWDILVRGQLGFAIPFLEELWSRNLVNLLMSPLRPSELVLSLMLVSLLRLAIAIVPVAALAYLFFSYNILSLGFAFAAFFANLMLTAWALGLVSTGIVLRYGLGAEGFVWLVVFVFMPVACVYYPVSTLPAWLQSVALALPPTHVFEGMRGVVLEQTFRVDYMIAAFALNVVALAVSYWVFIYLLQRARISGALLRLGE